MDEYFKSHQQLLRALNKYPASNKSKVVHWKQGEVVRFENKNDATQRTFCRMESTFIVRNKHTPLWRASVRAVDCEILFDRRALCAKNEQHPCKRWSLSFLNDSF